MMTADFNDLLYRVVAPESHAGGDCACDCFDNGFDDGVVAALAELEPWSWVCGSCGLSRMVGMIPCCPEPVIIDALYRIVPAPEAPR